MISKELLGEVLKADIRKINNSILDGNLYYYKTFVKCKSKINIYELAHKCKEWAYKRGFLYWYENSRLFIKIMYSCKVDFEIDIGEYKKPFEIDIDFKACQWILDNKES